METKRFDDLSLWQILGIQYAVAFMLEKAGVVPEVTRGITDSLTEGNMIISMGRDEPVNLQELTNIERNFPGAKITISGGKGKNGVFINIEMSREGFLQLIQKNVQVASPQPYTPNGTAIKNT